MDTTIKKEISFEIKSIGNEKDRVLRFVGSDETPDRDNDIIEVSGWKTDDYMKNPIVQWAHDYSMPPVGKTINIAKDMAKKKLIFDIKFPTIEEISSDVENPSEHAKFVDMIYNMCKNGYLNATSVGFRGIKFKTRDDESVLEMPEWQRGRRYIEQSLHEISIVPVPCNPSALQEAKAKGLISDIEVKSFFNEEKQVAEGGENLENDVEKSGARLSKETLESLQAIKSEMEEHHKAHMQVVKCYKGTMQKVKNLIGVDDGDGSDDETNEPSDAAEMPKSIDELFEIVKSLADEIKGLKVKEKTSQEFNLDEITFEDVKTVDKDELDITTEQLKQFITETIQSSLKFATGKI